MSKEVDGFNGYRYASDMTKREVFALEMAKAMLADVGVPADFDGFAKNNARLAVEAADALLAELAKDGAK
jgi:hypothetical protein